MNFTQATVLSTNVGSPQEFTFEGVTIKTSMRRSARPEGIKVHHLRVEGDTFESPQVHGIPTAAIYAYDASAFPFWTQQYEQPVGVGQLGENLTLSALDESAVYVGDEWSVGSVLLRSTSPRYPCNRLNFVFQRPDAQIRFKQARRPGVYFEVLQEGFIKTGDNFKLVRPGRRRWSIQQFFDLMTVLREGEKTAAVKKTFGALGSDPDIPQIYRKRFYEASLDSR